jgi:hypothetical protein
MVRQTIRLAAVALTATALTVGVAAAPAFAVAPDTTITSGPSQEAADNYVLPGPVTYTFTSNVVGATFECAVDSEKVADYAPCVSPVTLNLPYGTHYFRVRAVNGSPDPTPAVRWWYVRDVPCEQAGVAYQQAQANYFAQENKLSTAKRQLHRAHAHGTAAQLQHAKNKVRHIKKKAAKYEAQMSSLAALESAIC